MVINSRDATHDWVGSLVHVYVVIVAALTDSRQLQTLLLFMVCVP